MGLVIELILDAVAGTAFSRRRGREPWMSGLSAIVAGLIGAAAGILLYRFLFDATLVSFLAWALIPFMAAYIVLTLLQRDDAVKGGLAATGMAVAIAFPMALLVGMFSPWMGG